MRRSLVWGRNGETGLNEDDVDSRMDGVNGTLDDDTVVGTGRR